MQFMPANFRYGLLKMKKPAAVSGLHLASYLYFQDS